MSGFDTLLETIGRDLGRIFTENTPIAELEKAAIGKQLDLEHDVLAGHNHD